MQTPTDQSIGLTDYDPTWPKRFADQQTRLAVILAPWLAGAIEHIGSTSVPGLRSKPIVDMLAPVQSLTACRAAIPDLARDGWLLWPDDPNRNYRLWFLRPTPLARTHHLQIIQHDDPNLQALIAFRNALRRDPIARQAYATLKETLASRHAGDRNAYSNAKTEFVQSVLEAEGLGRSTRKPV
jgi:GrpB-like predicted nucleotidyltransferase (UPF0157 family)